jgi:translocation and assembly module TamA
MGEGGTLTDPDEPERDYFMVGLPGSVTYNGANSLLDATKGVRVMANAVLYPGEYNEDFTVLRTRLEVQAFLPLIGQDSLVMVFRGMYGFLNGEDASNLPASLRFYTGGGGSVRGYEY